MPSEIFSSSATTDVLCCLMDEEASHVENNDNTNQNPENGELTLRGSHCNWWNMVAVNVALLLIGQSGAVLLGKLYFDQGGKSTWMATLVQTAGFPVLFLPLFFFPFRDDRNMSSQKAKPSLLAIVFIYLSLGTLLAADNMLYSLGLLYLPISTYSIITASQLGFNAVFSVFINSEGLTFLILNSVVLITLSAVLAAFGGESSDGVDSKALSGGKYMIGFICTMVASAAYSLLLSLMQLSMERVIKKETFSVVLEMQIYTSMAATFVCLVGLLVSGEVNLLGTEMEGFGMGKILYVATLFGAALAWQLSSVGVVGLIFLVSALFTNVVSMLSLPLAPLAAVLFYGEKMEGTRIVAVCLTMWGFVSYAYQHYLDGDKVLPWQRVANTDSD